MLLLICHYLQFPLVSQSGRIRKLLLEAKDTKVSRINLTGLPSGSDAFELVAKFYYRVNVDITISNVALLRCVDRFMEMTEDITEKHLEIRTEVFLKDVVFQNISNSISVLHRCETLLPVSEKVNLVSQLTNAIANNVCKEQLTSSFSKLEYNFPPKPAQYVDSETLSEWWGKSLAKRQRIIVETIAGLLPTQSRKSTVPMAFLSSLLKSAIVASTSSCMSDLERRIGLHLD
ncbi:hypothetical protein BC332_27750 [Capsicum chinense]|nr:hypothetical protein BC332_27750 [Capsicum chinense]